MDDRTRVLISLGASTAANCVPCFEHYFAKAEASSLSAEDIQEAVALAEKVRSGAQISMRTSIERIRGGEGGLASPCCEESERSCCD